MMNDLKIIDVEQGSQEWFAARAGKVTASHMSDVLAQGKGGAPAATRQQYIARLVVEQLTGQPGDMFSNKWTEHGNETEPQARAFYQLETGEEVEVVGMVLHPTIENSGCSPDGLLRHRNGLTQFKCPSHAVHMDTLMGKPIDGKYLKQMHWEMACTGADFNDYISFNPFFPDSMKMKIIRVHRDPGLIIEYSAAVKQILAEVEEAKMKLLAQYGAA